MRLNQFEMIAALEACDSLSEASEKLYISQPSISKAIRELEEEIGCTILKRTKTGVEFTEQGMQVLQYAKEILERIDKIKQLQFMRDETIFGTLSFGVTRFWSSDIFSRVILGFKDQYPNVAIQFHEGYSSDIIDDVKNNRLNFGIIMVYSTDEAAMMQKIVQSGLEYQILFSDEVRLYANYKHPLSKKAEVYMKEVVSYSYITGGNAAIADYSKQLLQSYGYQKEIEMISNQRLLLRYLSNNEAFTSMPERVYQESAECQRVLKLLPVCDLSWHCQVGVVYRAREWSPLENLVLKRLQERLKG